MTQSELAMPAVTAPKSFSIDQLRALIAQGIEALNADKRHGQSFAMMMTVARGDSRAALCALEAVTTGETNKLVRQVRALSQLLAEAVAHALRHSDSPAPFRAEPALSVALQASPTLRAFEPETLALNPS